MHAPCGGSCADSADSLSKIELGASGKLLPESTSAKVSHSLEQIALDY